MQEVNVLGKLKTNLEKYRANRVYERETYNELLSEYEEAIRYIEILETTIGRLHKKTMPTRDEIESMKAVLNLFGIDKLDTDGICKLSQLQDMVGGGDR